MSRCSHCNAPIPPVRFDDELGDWWGCTESWCATRADEQDAEARAAEGDRRDFADEYAADAAREVA